MTDRELLEAAATAAGYGTTPLEWSSRDETFRHRVAGEWVCWNPLTDDGDAFRLAVKCDIYVMVVTEQGHASARVRNRLRSYWHEPIGDDPCAAARRVIVRAAASMAAS